MLQRRERLTRQQFEQHGRIGKRFHSSIATISYSPAPHFSGAVVVSKKVSKLAVERNTLRRRVYALLYQAKLQGHTGVFVVILKPEAKRLSRVAFLSAVREIIGRIEKHA